MTDLAIPDAVLLPLADLRPHPRNYRTHPQDQLEHLAESIREHGFYRNVVVAREKTILAGHGIVQAAKLVGLAAVPCVVLDLSPKEPRALKILTGDNTILHLAEDDDRALSELLKEIQETDDVGLLGTGYDAMMLANLAMVTRPSSEIADFDEAAQWAGMPEYQTEASPANIRLMVTFRSEEDKSEFGRILNLSLTTASTSTWWPAKEHEDYHALLFGGNS
jgi:hypothetical protein